MTARPITVEFARYDDGIPCECGGYCERVDCTPEEIRQYDCGKSFECCSRAFVCKVCSTRWVGKAEVPDPDRDYWDD